MHIFNNKNLAVVTRCYGHSVYCIFSIHVKCVNNKPKTASKLAGGRKLSMFTLMSFSAEIQPFRSAEALWASARFRRYTKTDQREAFDTIIGI